FCDWPNEEAAQGLQSSRCGNFATLHRVDRYLGRRFTKTRPQRASLAMAMRTLQARPRSFGAPRCAWPRPGQSIALFARPRASGSVPWKSSAGLLTLLIPPGIGLSL